MAEEQQKPMSESLNQKKKRTKKAEVFMSDLKRFMKKHGYNNQQAVYQTPLFNVIAADFDTAAWMLRSVTTPYKINEKVSRAFRTQSLVELLLDAGDEVLAPVNL